MIPVQGNAGWQAQGAAASRMMILFNENLSHSSLNEFC